MFHILKVCNIKMELTRVIRIVSKTMFLYDIALKFTLNVRLQ